MESIDRSELGWVLAGLLLAAPACSGDDGGLPPADDGAGGSEDDGEDDEDDENDEDDEDDEDDGDDGDDGDDEGGGDDDPPPPDDGDDDADPPPSDDGDDDGGPIGACRPTATRVIVLGDSIAACQGVGGKDSGDCAPKRFHEFYATTYGPVSYENLAVSGAQTAGLVNQQLPSVATGQEGHALVVIYIGGNDLSPLLLAPEATVESAYANLSTQLDGHWSEIYAFFEDPAKFPDGATILMNTQYDPWDLCTTAPWNVSQTKLQLLVQYNEEMTARADARDWVFIADQHSPFLGHGHHSGASECPYYEAGAEGWMNDLIHPNAAGHANLAEIMGGTTATMYEGC